MEFHKSRAELVGDYLKVRALSVEICSSLTEEDNNLQITDDCSPNKWHLGHTSWFFESFILAKYKNGYNFYNQDWLYYLNSYYVNKGKRLSKADRHKISRPRFTEILNYRKIIDNLVIEFISKNDDPKILSILELGLNHEQQHQELMLQDIKLNFFEGATGYYYRTKEFDITHKKDPSWLDFSEGIYQFGAEDGAFYYDNEKEVHKRFLHNFKLSKNLVTNSEYLEFIESGGYSDSNNWLSDGWSWIGDNNIEAPLYWIKDGDGYLEFTMNGLKSLEPNKPVSHLSYFEAYAFAKYRGKRLPTEFELELAAKTHYTESPNLLNNINNSILEPVGSGGVDFIGNLWEWTSSAYSAYPYYKQEPGAFGEYNGKFMNGQYVLKGGSSFTPKSHIRNSYRNFYQPEKRWVQSGFRLAENI